MQVGVKVLLQNPDGLFLFLKRADPLPDGSGVRWDIPGGRVNEQEQLHAALIRELKEETGISNVRHVIIASAQDIIFDSTHIVRLTYLARTDQVDVTLSAEHRECKWLTLKQALERNIDAYLEAVLRQSV